MYAGRNKIHRYTREHRWIAGQCFGLHMVHMVSLSDLFKGTIICIIASGSITPVVQVAKKMEIKRSIQDDLQQLWHGICLVYLIKEREVCGKVGVIDALLHLLLVLSREREIWPRQNSRRANLRERSNKVLVFCRAAR